MLYILKNAAAYNRGELKDFSQVGARAVDSTTLELTLNGPAPYFPSMLKHYSWFPVPKHVVEKHGAKHDRNSRWTLPEHLVCNGPFQLAEWRFTQVLRVTRNPRYWDAAEVKLQQIQFFPISSDSTEERAFQDGQLHLTATVPLPLIPQFRESRDPQFHNDAILACAFYRFNTTRPPFTDKRVRQALSMAIDRTALVEQVLRSGQIACTGLTPPGCTPGYEAPQVVSFNPAKARALLEQAGFPNGQGFPEFEILINTNEAHRVLAEAIQAMLKEHLQLKVKIINQDWQVYLETQRNMQFTLCRAGWLGDYPDPMTFLSLWRTGDGNNNTGFSSAAYDQLIQSSMSEPDTHKRLQTLQQAERLLLEEMPILPLYWQTHSYLMRPELKGAAPSVLEHRCYKAWTLKN
jgi:oligopeptide transport system substrate-binding protein